MKTQAELAAQVRSQSESLAKIGKEIDITLQKVKDLETAVKNQDNASEELIAAVQAVSDQLQIVDDKVPDGPTA